MRDIKFRAKGNDEETKNRWFKGYYCRLNDTTYCFKEDYDRDQNNTKHYIVFEEMVDWGLPNRHLRADIDVNTLGEYTGLKDKNRKEIYEGDIVKFRFKDDREEFPDLIGYIEYQTTFTAFRIMSNQGSFKIDITEIKFIEVIGNIYDNPELLEKGE